MSTASVLEVLSVTNVSRGLYQVLLPPCRLDVLSWLLSPHIPFIWLFDYRVDENTVREMENLVALHSGVLEGGGSVIVRRVEMDCFLRTEAFLKVLPALGPHGIDLIQAHKPLPRTLDIATIADSVRGHVYANNQVHLRFFLPHDHEYAVVTSPNMQTLSHITNMARSRI